MKPLLLFVCCVFFFAAQAQTDSLPDPSSEEMNIKSLMFRVTENEKKMEKFMAEYEFRRYEMKEAGRQIEGGVICMGIGLALGVVGGFLSGIRSENQDEITPPQIVGLIFGMAGTGLNIAGLIKIGVGGRKLKRANYKIERNKVSPL